MTKAETSMQAIFCNFSQFVFDKHLADLENEQCKLRNNRRGAKL